MIETYKQFTFEAAHKLPPHSDLHGHSFRVGLVFRGVADPVFGWVENLDVAETKIQALWKKLDHSYLNDIEGLENPSLENVAKWIWEQLSPEFGTLSQVTMARGPEGQSEGCSYQGREVALV